MFQMKVLSLPAAHKITLTMGAAHSSEMFMPPYRITWHQIRRNVQFSPKGQ